ncbi:hypothetical protein [Streptomyces sp. NBC_00029]
MGDEDEAGFAAGAIDVRLDSRATQRGLRTTLRGARQFLRPGIVL